MWCLLCLQDDGAVVIRRRISLAFPAAASSRKVSASRKLLLVLVLLGYGLTPLLVPLFIPVAIGDDRVYVRSVEILLREGRLHILDLSVVTLLFQGA